MQSFLMKLEKKTQSGERMSREQVHARVDSIAVGNLSLNLTCFNKETDYQTNRLVSGILQLAEGSHLTIDETQLLEGTLNPTGVENARALRSLLELQRLNMTSLIIRWTCLRTFSC
ncbi:hypothetical protein K7X08_035604 [Anisodus acutangulus]|uniref:Uncharacterized protein n=1 Tax=Anisodus acutangulus TaxID=402998 RepID=A0A9Q1LLE2_9SOLA|nr:hypothetical protein K7X08_035604 [Anisodus acutangulus]